MISRRPSGRIASGDPSPSPSRIQNVSTIRALAGDGAYSTYRIVIAIRRSARGAECDLQPLRFRRGGTAFADLLAPHRVVQPLLLDELVVRTRFHDAPAFEDVD